MSSLRAAGAATVTLQAFLDEDDNASTGCAVPTASGTFSGAEQVLTTTVDTTAGEVTAVSLQTCSGGVLGAPVSIASPHAPPWPIGFGAGVSGSALIETYMPVPAGGHLPLFRAGFVSTDQTGAQDGILQGNILVVRQGPAPATGIPTLSEWGFLALGLLLSLAGLLILKRGGGGSLLVVLIVFALAAGVAWAAITLTGNPADWAGVPPVATQAPDANPTHAEIYAVYSTSDGTDLFFRFDVKLCPVITVSPTTLSDGTINAAYPSTTFTQTGGAASIAWAESGALPSGMTFSTGGTLSGTPTQTGTFPITFTATDANGCKGSQAITLTVNACPPITVTNPATATGTANAAFSQTFTQSGAAGTATFTTSSALPTGLTLATNGTLSGTPTQTGSFPIVVKVTDGNGCTGTGSTYTLVINCQTITVTNPATATGTANSAFSQIFTQTGAIGTATFTISSTLPTGLTLATNGTLSGTPTLTGSFPIVVKVTDSNGCTGTGATYTLVIGCQTITVNNPATATGTANSAFSQTFTATNAIGTTTFTTSSTLPTGLTLATNGTLSGTPTQTGSFPIVVKATDANGCFGTGSTYTLVINCQTITITNPATATGTVNSAFSQTFTAGNAIGAKTFTTVSTLPTGLTLATNGTLSGTPTQTGSFPIVVKVTDGNGCTGTGSTYTLVINCQTITVTNPATTAGTASSAFSQIFTQSGAIGTATFSTTSTLPTGLTLATNGTLSGTPTQTGSFPITVKVTDSNGCTGTGATYTLVIGCQTITVTDPATTTGTANATFSQTFTQTGAIGTATFSTTSTLPTGLTLATNGTLSGTPTQAGSFPIVVKVTDSNGCTGTGATYTLVIGCQTITVTDPATTTGTANTAFSQTFTQSGAIGTATFTTSSTLPTGLSLATNGTLSGTPTQTGSFPIVVTVTDGNGCTGSGSTYTLVIGCQTITVNNPATTTGTAGSAFSQTFTQGGAIGTATFTTSSTLPAGLTLGTSGTLSGTPTQAGSFPVVVTVTDCNGCTGSGATYTLVIGCQTITVTNPATTTGTVNAAFSQTFTQGGAIGTATFTTASTLPTGLTLATNGTLSGTPTQTGSFPIVVTVTDSNGCSGSGSTYTLVIGCQIITVEPSSLPSGTSGSAYTPIQFTQTGAVGSVTFGQTGTLPTGMSFSVDTLSGTPTQTGSFPITVTATDSNNCTGSRDYVLVISCVGATISVDPTSLPGATSGTFFTASFTGSGGTGSYTFAQTGTLPTGLGFSGNTLSGTPTQTGAFPITIVATDANGCQGSRDYLVVVRCAATAITVSPATLLAGLTGTEYSDVTFGATGGTSPYTFSQTGVLPAGMTFSAGVLSGTPSQSGAFPITVAVTDASGCTGSRDYTLTIDEPPAITSASSALFPPSVFTSFTVTTTGFPTGASMTITESGALPTNVTFVDNHDGTATISGTPSGTGSFPIVITASNGISQDATQNFTIQLCPTISVTNPATATGTAGVAFSQTFTQSGGNGTITWSESGALPAGITLNSSSGVLSGTTNTAGSFPIVVTATDVNGCQGAGATYTLTISCQTVTVTNPGVNTGTVDAAFSQTFTASGILGTVTWSETGALPAGVTLSSSTGVLSGTPTVNGSFPITIKATDTNGCFGTSSYTLTINCQTITVTKPSTATGTVDAAFSQTFTQSGAHGTATFTTASTLPAGLTLSTSGTLSGAPTVKGTFPIVVTVTDSNGCTGTSSTYTLVINCQTITVTKPSTATGTVNAAFSQTFTQGGAHGTGTFTTASTLPAGLSLSTSGVLSGTPTQAGSFPIVVTVTDSNGCTGTSSTYTLVIGCQVISVTNPATTSGTVNAVFSQTFTQSGGNGTITWSKTGTLPAGLTFHTGTGVLDGTPTQAGSFPITITATDGNGCTGTGATYTLVIACQTITPGPASIPAGTSGSVYSSTVITQTGGVGTVTFTTASTLPTGMTLATNGTLSGTPTQTGSFPITVTVTDSNNCAGSRNYLLVISCSGTPITISPGSLPTVTVNTAYAGTTFSASGGNGTYTFSEAGTLPSGMSFDAPTHTLSGTPTQTGSFPITVSVVDGNTCAGLQDYLLVVACNGTTVTVSPGSLSSGTVGTAYPQVIFSAANGTLPYTFSEAGALPSGMSFDPATAKLSGTPSKAGTFPITVSATDANGCAGATSYSLVIVCQAITVTNPATSSGTAGTAFSQTFTQSGGIGTITWSKSGTLPTGLTFHTATGVLDGTPTQTGTFPITVTATDGNGCQWTGPTYSLVIVCPAITVSRNGGGSFPAGTYNVAYTGQSVTASGGTGSYTFALHSGDRLPNGLTMSSAGAISGTPTATGTFTFTVLVTDSNTQCISEGPLFSIAIRPVAVNITYPVLVNNTEAYVTGGMTSAPATPAVQLSGTILSFDQAFNGLGAGLAALPGTFSSTNGSNNVVIMSDGTFKYTSPVTVSPLSTDSFTYTISSDTGGTGTATTATGTVNLVFNNRVWYVKNNAAAGGNGQSQSPFNTLAAAQTASTASDIIFVYNGDGTTTGQNAGITLKSSQQLIGEGVALVVNTNTLVVAGTKPQITNTTAASDVVTLNDGNTIKGLTVTGATRDGISSVSAHAGFTADSLTVQNNVNVGVDLISMTGTVTITNSAISTVSNHALTINNGTAAVTMDNTNTINGGTGTAVSVINRPASAGAIAIGATITNGQIQLLSNLSGTISFTGSQTLSNGAVSGITMTTNTGTTIGFSGTLNVTTTTGIPFQTSGGGTLNVTGTANLTAGAATAGLSLNGTTVGGSGVTFTSVNTTGANGGIAMLNVTGTVAVNGGTITNGTTGVSLQGSSTSLTLAGVTITGPATGIASTTNFGTLTIGSSVNVSAATALNLTTGTVNGTFANVTSTGGVNGISLTSIAGTWGASSSASSLSGASGNTLNISGGTETFTYPGSISGGTNTVNVSGATGGTIALSGAIASSPISLTTNTGATINFTGALTLSTGASAAFTATGGGTVSATNATSTLTTTTGTALNVANTTIGASGLTFQSISAGTTSTPFAVNGIVLNNTGSSGGLTVLGTGSAGSGGTIQGTTGNAIDMTSTGAVSLSWMIIQNSTHLGINGTTLAGFTLAHSSVINNGTTANVDDGIRLLDVSGDATFTSNTVTGNHVTNLFFGGITSSAVVTNSLTVTNGTYGSAVTNSGIQVGMTGTSELKTATFTNVTFSSNASSGLQVQSNDSSIVGDGVGVPATGTVTVSGCTFTNNAGNVGVDIDQGGGNGAGQMYARIMNNLTMTGNGQAINIFDSSSATGGTMKVRIDGNHIGNAAVTGSGSTGGPAVRIELQGRTTNTITLVNNIVRQTPGSRAIDIEAPGPTATGQPITVSDIVITGNDADTNDELNPSGSLDAIYIAADDQGSPAQINAEIHENILPSAGTHCYDYPTFDGNAPWLYYRIATSGGVAKLFNFGGHADANLEIAVEQILGTAGADITNFGGVQLTSTAVNSIP